MRKFITILLLMLCVATTAQTRRIAHRSHSGANSEHYAKGDGSYGDPGPYKISVHLESGRDTLVWPWDSLANPKYYADTTPRAKFYPRDTSPKEDIREMGLITHKLITRS